MNPYCSLAKKAIEVYIKQGKVMELPKNLAKEFYQKKAGAFVSLHKGDFLRGCIGTYLPTKENIGQEIISNALATTQDPRFAPLEPKELKFLFYEVYVLDRPEPVNNLAKLNPKKFGLIVKSLTSTKSALLLPDLEGIDSAKEQFLVCCQKAGIEPGQEQISLYRFRAKKHSDK